MGIKTSKEEVLEKCLKALKKNTNAVTLSDMFSAIPYHKDTFYNYIKVGSPDYNKVIEALEENKVNLKYRIRDRLLDSNQATALIALYKLVGTDEERVALSNVNVKKEEQKDDKDGKTSIKLTIS